ncbi:MAG TPA: c-type cytochrome, partial [Desulfuromonadaceae bacterium]|nr:c-type cytochrome [Desulfuromonadaceae bacterium]
MHLKAVVPLSLFLLLAAHAAEPQSAPIEPARQVREYRDFAMGHDGNAARGREIFNDKQRVACVKCHSVDGTGSKAGPDLFAVGDNFPRRELATAVLEPSATIAIGYGTTMVEMTSGEEFQGIVKETTPDSLELA